MEEVKTRAIVLRTVKYGDNAIIADLLTEAQGRVSFLVRIPKTARGRVRRQHFLPLTLLSIDYDFRLRSSLQRLREVRIDQPYLHIPINPSKQAILLFLAEFLTYATRDEQQNVPLFLFIRSSLLWLDETEARFANFHLVFMARMSRFLGFWPNLEDYHEGCYFDLRGATFTPLRPLHPDFLPPEDAAHVGLLMRISYHYARFSSDTRGAQPHRRDHAVLLPPPRTQHARSPFPSRAPRTVCRRMTTRSEDGLQKRDLRSQVTQGNCSAGIPLAIRQTIPAIQQQVLAMATTLSCQTFGRTSFFSYFCSIVAT